MATGRARRLPVAPGVHRIPLPLPTDGLRAVNSYALETRAHHDLLVARGLVLCDQDEEEVRYARRTIGACRTPSSSNSGPDTSKP